MAGQCSECSNVWKISDRGVMGCVVCAKVLCSKCAPSKSRSPSFTPLT
eukprot:gene22792-45475_t